MTNYVCPIHSDTQSHRQGTTCPRCGMKLEPREDQRTTTNNPQKPSPVREK